jgi:hypothetical protein
MSERINRAYAAAHVAERAAARPGHSLHYTALNYTALHCTSARRKTISIVTFVTRGRHPDRLELIMATDAELTRLADAASGLRPDWPARSVRAYLARHHPSRSFADLAIALAVAAGDPRCQTPAVLDRPGAWWAATRFAVGAASTQSPGPDGDPCGRPGHEHEPAASCRACAAERLADDAPDLAPQRPVPPPAEFRSAPQRQPADVAPRVLDRAALGQEFSLAGIDDVRACHCSAMFVDTADGRASHRTVFGHMPSGADR